MKLGRYRNVDWKVEETLSHRRMVGFIEQHCHVSVAYEAQYMLKAHYGGPLRMIRAIAKREFKSWLNHYFGSAWERSRVSWRRWRRLRG